MNTFQQVDILLAEDTATDAEMTMRALRKRGLANNLIWVKDGSEAIDFLFHQGTFAGTASGKPKLVLLDVKMPKVDGIDVLRRIRADPDLHAVPVVMLTSSAEERDMVESYRLGANSYIVKPVDTFDFDKIISDTGFYWMLVNKVPA
ncbi:putative response regulator receiver (Che-Y like) [Oxalobacteraceae bacterium IMCC9480]|nr:putative response regulator receiver (Che-Y like) [Oxalobacteraceae bacterium IMCC9480]NDP60134.1 response regulator [Oxalobacteraceae bacterium]